MKQIPMIQKQILKIDICDSGHLGFDDLNLFRASGFLFRI